MRDAYKSEADAVADKHNLPHDLIDELELRGLKVKQFEWSDYSPPYNQGVHLVDKDGNEVITKISDHPARATIATLDEILTKEREGQR